MKKIRCDVKNNAYTHIVRNKFFCLALVTVLIGTGLVACGQRSEQISEKETANNTVYENIENGLVGETKLFAQKMAEFAHSNDFLLYTTDEGVLDVASSFAQIVMQYEEPLSAKRYVIDRNSISDNLSGGALSHEEVLSYYAQIYPLSINNKNGISTVAAASVLTINSAYPQPEEFNGTQIIELKYSSNLSVFAIYTETDNETIQCVITPIFGEIEEKDTFSNVASSGSMGISFVCSEFSCDPTVACSLADCKMQTEKNMSSENWEISVAQDVMERVGKKANTAFLNMVGCPDSAFEYSLSCQSYSDLAPSYAVIWTENNLFDIYSLEKDVIQNNLLLESKLAQGLSSYLCSFSGNTEMMSSQSIMEVTTSLPVSKGIDPVIICLLYESEDGVLAGMVSMWSGETGCVLVNAAPLWNISTVNSIVEFYNTGKEITEYPELLNNWLMSGEYVIIASR